MVTADCNSPPSTVNGSSVVEYVPFLCMVIYDAYNKSALTALSGAGTVL